MFDEPCSIQIELHICLYLITAAWAKSFFMILCSGHSSCQSFWVWCSLLVLLFILVSHFSSSTFRHKNIERFHFSLFPLSELIQEIFPFFYFLKNGCYIHIKMMKSTLAVSPSALNMCQSYCLRKEQKDVGGFPTLINIVNTVSHNLP